MGFTWARCHRIPEPLRRTSTTRMSGTLHHSRIDRPACAPISGGRHLAGSFASIPQMFANRFLRDHCLGEATCHPCQGSRATMREKSASQKHSTIRVQELRQVAQSRTRNVQNSDHILAMPVHKGLEPICPIDHSTHPCARDQATSARLHLRHIGPMGGIGQTGERREVFDRNLLLVSRVRRHLSHGQTTDILSRVLLFLPALLRLGGWPFFHPLADFFTEPTGGFGS